MQISELLTASSIVIPLRSTDRDGIIAELVKAAPFSRSHINEETVVKAVIERENVTSTGIGDGVAIPHAKCDIKEELLMSVGVADNPIEFAAIDNKPARIFFMLLSRKDVSGLHIKMLAKIAKLARLDNFREGVLLCKNAAELLELFRKEEAAIL